MLYEIYGLSQKWFKNKSKIASDCRFVSLLPFFSRARGGNIASRTESRLPRRTFVCSVRGGGGGGGGGGVAGQ